MRAISKRVAIGVPLVSLLIAVGQPIGTARATLESRGLDAGREQSRVEPGSAISLWVAAVPPRTPDRAVFPPEPSRPPRGVLVPDLINGPANQVASILEHSGLRLGEQPIAIPGSLPLERANAA